MTDHLQPLRGWKRLIERFAATRAGAWYFLNIAPHIDRPLVRLSRGRFSSAIARPVALLTTVGARSGLPRTVPLLFFTAGSNVVLIASRGGSQRHPDWYHNLRANPRATLLIDGRSATFVAREASGSERDALWGTALMLYRGYHTYQQRTAGRQIPVMVLEPAPWSAECVSEFASARADA